MSSADPVWDGTWWESDDMSVHWFLDTDDDDDDDDSDDSDSDCGGSGYRRGAAASDATVTGPTAGQKMKGTSPKLPRKQYKCGKCGYFPKSAPHSCFRRKKGKPKPKTRPTKLAKPTKQAAVANNAADGSKLAPPKTVPTAPATATKARTPLAHPARTPVPQRQVSDSPPGVDTGNTNATPEDTGQRAAAAAKMATGVEVEAAVRRTAPSAVDLPAGDSDRPTVAGVDAAGAPSVASVNEVRCVCPPPPSLPPSLPAVCHGGLQTVPAPRAARAFGGRADALVVLHTGFAVPRTVQIAAATAATASIGSKRARPRDRPPNGKRWDCAAGEWVDLVLDAAASSEPQKRLRREEAAGEPEDGIEKTETAAVDVAEAEAATPMEIGMVGRLSIGTVGCTMVAHPAAKRGYASTADADGDAAPAQQTDIGALDDQPPIRRNGKAFATPVDTQRHSMAKPRQCVPVRRSLCLVAGFDHLLSPYRPPAFGTDSGAMAMRNCSQSCLPTFPDYLSTLTTSRLSLATVPPTSQI